MPTDGKYTVMTVCTGNICRSPMAEIVLRKYVADAGLDGSVEVRSSGVSSEEQGNPIDPRARRVLRERGYGLPGSHYAHRITADEIRSTDLFLPMTAAHMRSLLRQIPSGDAGKVHMYRSFDPKLPQPEAGNEETIDLADPWYGGPEDFETAMDQIETAAPYIVGWIRRRLQANTN
ncbi:hypothetical protein HMPREF9156_00420 [Scardovia wiggsiae F0424]|uniref:protein-tyrosine-phosphatase n=1 Tax=Scardovia wiggsiae F0424 TaxID=857290 RepID=J0X2M8_9BIFI|nr:low molecular weight protein-tyrosine-phosphatase [Scardovia wiggsiae]EJD65656.1 hypothetical protein HMPREF9156_00420 [Scardovia wiggsiae F0424]